MIPTSCWYYSNRTWEGRGTELPAGARLLLNPQETRLHLLPVNLSHRLVEGVQAAAAAMVTAFYYAAYAYARETLGRDGVGDEMLDQAQSSGTLYQMHFLSTSPSEAPEREASYQALHLSPHKSA